MKKIIYIVFVLLFLIAAKPASAFVAEKSAEIKSKNKNKTDTRNLVLKSFLDKKKSPLSEYSDILIEKADENGLDYRLIPAISGVESNFGKRIPYNSYNAYGWANGDFYFDSWEDSIEIVSDTLKKKYIDKGARKINQIAKIYAPPSTTWAKNVKYFVNQIDPTGLSFDID
jgi:hypothetical protein